MFTDLPAFFVFLAGFWVGYVLLRWMFGEAGRWLGMIALVCVPGVAYGQIGGTAGGTRNWAAVNYTYKSVISGNPDAAVPLENYNWDLANGFLPRAWTTNAHAQVYGTGVYVGLHRVGDEYFGAIPLGKYPVVKGEGVGAPWIHSSGVATEVQVLRVRFVPGAHGVAACYLAFGGSEWSRVWPANGDDLQRYVFRADAEYGGVYHHFLAAGIDHGYGIGLNAPAPWATQIGVMIYLGDIGGDGAGGGVSGEDPTQDPAEPDDEDEQAGTWIEQMVDGIHHEAGERDGEPYPEGGLFTVAKSPEFKQLHSEIGTWNSLIQEISPSVDLETDLLEVAGWFMDGSSLPLSSVWAGELDGTPLGYVGSQFGGVAGLITFFLSGYAQVKLWIPQLFWFLRVVCTGWIAWHAIVQMLGVGMWALGIERSAIVEWLSFGGTKDMMTAEDMADALEDSIAYASDEFHGLDEGAADESLPFPAVGDFEGAHRYLQRSRQEDDLE